MIVLITFASLTLLVLVGLFTSASRVGRAYLRTSAGILRIWLAAMIVMGVTFLLKPDAVVPVLDAGLAQAPFNVTHEQTVVGMLAASILLLIAAEITRAKYKRLSIEEARTPANPRFTTNTRQAAASAITKAGEHQRRRVRLSEYL